MLVFILHFHNWSDFLHLHATYEPTPPQVVVPQLIAAANRWPLIHDPHVVGYLILPLIPACALGLYSLGRNHRPVLAALGLSLSITGGIYTGGDFGMWTAFRRGFGAVDPRYVDGAIASFAALTAPHGAFLLTTQLAKLLMLGLLLQIAALWGRPHLARWSILAAGCGCLLFLAFWDVDQVMLLGAGLMLIGFSAIRPQLARGAYVRPT